MLVVLNKHIHLNELKHFQKKSLNKLTHKSICTVPILTQFKRYYFKAPKK